MATRTVEAGLKWYVTIKDMPHEQGFSYPVLQWSYGEDGFRGGELELWPVQGTIVFTDRRPEGPEEEPRIFDDPKKALAMVETYGWGKPHGFDGAFAAMQLARRSFPPKDSQAAQGTFDDLKLVWQAVVEPA